jgi:hypothetical protein
VVVVFLFSKAVGLCEPIYESRNYSVSVTIIVVNRLLHRIS